MNKLFIYLLFTVLFLIFIGCGDNDTSVDGNGSCTQNDTSVNPPIKMCYEKQELDATFKIICDTLGGSWSASKCDALQYSRKCVQEMQESTNDGPEQTVHYIYYYKSESTMSCMGDETTL